MSNDAIVLRLCDTCDGPAWDGVPEAVAAAGLDAPVQIEMQACMNGCARPRTLALQGVGRATYFFDGVDPVDDLEDIVGTLRAYIAAPKGWIEDARPCGRLRFCLRGRVPAL